MQSEQPAENIDASDISTIRRGILLFLQDPAILSDLEVPIQKLNALSSSPLAGKLPEIRLIASECVRQLEAVSAADRSGSERSLRSVLDQLVLIEASMLADPMAEDLSLTNISAFVDESFEHLTRSGPSDIAPDVSEPEPGFEIDDETLDIFRTEASELLNAISANLIVLAQRPADREALWEMRRSIHTLKGAAGVIGMRDASDLAHRMEDLLGQLVDNGLDVTTNVFELLNVSVEHLNRLSEGDEADSDLADLLPRFDTVIEENSSTVSSGTEAVPIVSTLSSPAIEAVKATSAPIVRVSLERLYELQTLAREMAMCRTELAETLDVFVKGSAGVQPDSAPLLELESILDQQLRLSNELQEKLDQIRMVRFGVLTTRLNRAVHVTCQEDNKKAELIVECEDVELDTQIIDALVEPLLHLLRNAVVHGVEPPEMRRMIGKPERARIVVGVERNESEVVLSVSDDGRGISASKLKEKALACGSISKPLAESMNDEEAMELMFLRGVTTAEKLSLNAGRGIGMSIVRESVESRGGSITIQSEAQKGSTFIIRLRTTPVVAKSAPEPHIEPKIDVQPEVRSAAAAVMVPRSDLSILIVDDSALMRQTISKVVERAGWQAFSANDGRQALDFLRKSDTRPDIIITDLEMPVLDGLRLIETLKRDPKLLDIPVIMITSRSERIHREKAFAIGAAKFLTKPIEGIELKSIINSLCLVEV